MQVKKMKETKSEWILSKVTVGSVKIFELRFISVQQSEPLPRKGIRISDFEVDISDSIFGRVSIRMTFPRMQLVVFLFLRVGSYGNLNG